MNNVTYPNIYQCGNTVFINCKFEFNEEVDEKVDEEVNQEGQSQVIDPDNVSIKIYNHKYELQKVIPQDQITREDVGQYSYGYVLPMEETVIIYQWVGELNGGISTKRGAMKAVFLDY